VRRIFSDAYYAMFEHLVLERVRVEVGERYLSVEDACLAVLPTVIAGLREEVELSGVHLGGLHLLRAQKSMKGSLFDKTFDLRAFYIDAGGGWHSGALPCLYCDEWLLLGGAESGYILRHRDTKPTGLFAEEAFYVSKGSRLSRDFGGAVASGPHRTRMGLGICQECALTIAAADPHEESLIAELMSRADTVFEKQLHKRAIEDLTYAERWQLRVERERAAAEKRRLVRGAAGRVAVKLELGSDGVLREVGD
jgi:hypothetical protein